MDKMDILGFLAELDKNLSTPTTLYIYGSAVVILLDAPERTSLDIDVAGPYSCANQAEFDLAASRARLPVNPDPTYDGPHIEWVGPLRLCLPPPSEYGMLLWQGAMLTIRTGSVEDLVASKLIRYDPTDRADVQYLFHVYPFSEDSVGQALQRLPAPYRTDALVVEHFRNLASDMELWRGMP